MIFVQDRLLEKPSWPGLPQNSRIRNERENKDMLYNISVCRKVVRSSKTGHEMSCIDFFRFGSHILNFLALLDGIGCVFQKGHSFIWSFVSILTKTERP